MRKKLLIIGDFSANLEAEEGTTIVEEKDKTLSHFILKVDDEETGIQIDLDGKAKFLIGSIKDMYEEGLTVPLKNRPWLLTYDDTNNIFVVVFEPEYPLEFKQMYINIVPPANKTVTYAYECGFVTDVQQLDKKLDYVATLLERVIAELRVGGERGRG